LNSNTLHHQDREREIATHRPPYALLRTPMPGQYFAIVGRTTDGHFQLAAATREGDVYGGTFESRQSKLADLLLALGARGMD